MGGFPIDSILLNCHVPIHLKCFDLRFGMIVRKMEGLSDEMSRQIVDAYIKGIQQGFYQDVAIWDNKVRIDNPLLCEGDGPIYKLREWYRQFYLDAAEVPEEAHKRQVVELNVGLPAPPAPASRIRRLARPRAVRAFSPSIAYRSYRRLGVDERDAQGGLGGQRSDSPPYDSVSLSLAEFSELVAAIYEGPLEAVPWKSALDLLRRHLRASYVTLMLRPPSADARGADGELGGRLADHARSRIQQALLRARSLRRFAAGPRRHGARN